MSDPILKLPEVVKETGRSRSSLYEDIKAGRFPKPISIGPQAKGWRLSAVERWKREREQLTD